jgi:hypothetical protein
MLAPAANETAWFRSAAPETGHLCPARPGSKHEEIRVRTLVPAQRARAVLAVTVIGASSVVFSLGGVAQAAPTWSTTGTGAQAAIPAGICSVDWVLEGGAGGGAVPGGRLVVTTGVTAGAVYQLYPGTAGSAAAGETGGEGGTTGSPAVGDDGQSGTSAATAGGGTGGAGGGAASVVYLDGATPTPFLSAFGGDGAAGAELDAAVVAGGAGGGGDTNTVSDVTLSPEAAAAVAGAAGPGSVTGTGVACAAPNAPTNLEATPGDGQLTVSFVPGTDTAAIADVTGWEISKDGTNFDPITPVDTAGVLSTVINGLANGTPQTVTVRASSAVGPGAEAQVSGTPTAPAAVPAAPTLAVAPGNGSLRVTISPVTETGKPDATGYQYKLDSGTWTALPNGTPYDVSVRGVAGTNGELEGTASLVKPGVPQDIPNAPTDVAVIWGDAQLSVSFRAGADTGAGMADVQGWEISTDGGENFIPFTATQDQQSGVWTGSRTGLTNGQPYSVVLQATSAVGAGRPSTVATGTPAAPVVNTPAAPNSPALNVALGKDRAIEVSISEVPLTAGIPAATGYEYRLDRAGEWTTLSTTEAQVGRVGTITGLTNGRTYTVEVRAVAGTAGELKSLPSRTATATPRYLLPAPGAVQTTVVPGAIKVTWAAPSGGVGVTGYEVHALPGDDPQSNAGMVSCTTGAADTDCVLPVPAGQPYTVSVFGVTADGVGIPVFVVSDVVPAVQKPAAVPTQDDGDLTGAAGPITSATAGEKLELRGSGYLPGSVVELFVYSTPVSLGSVVAGPDGTFTVEVTLPEGLAAGTHHLVATGVDADGNVHNLVIEVAVSASGAATVTAVHDQGLAYTGASIALPLGGGLLALLTGGGLMALARRRRTTV